MPCCITIVEPHHRLLCRRHGSQSSLQPEAERSAAAELVNNPDFRRAVEATAYANLLNRPRRPGIRRVITQSAEEMERSVQAALTAAAARAGRSRTASRRQQQQEARMLQQDNTHGRDMDGDAADFAARHPMDWDAAGFGDGEGHQQYTCGRWRVPQTEQASRDHQNWQHRFIQGRSARIAAVAAIQARHEAPIANERSHLQVCASWPCLRPTQSCSDAQVMPP